MEVKVILKRFLMGNGKERVHSEGLYEYGGIILKGILRIVSEWNLSIHASALHNVNVIGSMKMKLMGHAVFM